VETYEIAADLHCHTVASAHAYSTVAELAAAAHAKGLKAIAVTDHGPALQDGAPLVHFTNLRILPHEINGVRVLQGAEANVVDFAGNLDLNQVCFDRLEWIIASFHEDVIAPGTAEQHTHAYEKLAENPYIDVIGHSGTECFPYDYERLIPIFGEKKKLVEINNHTFLVRSDSQKNCRRIALLCKQYGVPVVVSTDAHFAGEVGEVSQAMQMLHEIDFPSELIVNRNMDALLRRLSERKNALG
jgi:putative hydrolase